MKILIDQKRIETRISEMAKEIDTYYRNQDWYKNTNNPVLILGVMNGAIFFLTDLIRQLTIRFDLDLLTTIGSNLRFQPTPRSRDSHVLLIDDILDSGSTLRTCSAFLPYDNINTAVLLRKPNRNMPVDFIGFDIPSRWVAGYGMDDQQGRRREVQYIFVDEEETK